MKKTALGKVLLTHDDFIEFDGLLRAMFFSYVKLTLIRECNAYNNTKRYHPLVDYNAAMLESIIEDGCTFQLNVSCVKDMFNYFEDEHLLQICRMLTDRDKMILYLKFQKELTDLEISKILHISRQGITKRRNQIIQFISNHY